MSLILAVLPKEEKRIYEEQEIPHNRLTVKFWKPKKKFANVTDASNMVTPILIVQQNTDA